MANNKDNRWPDDDLGEDVMENMFSSKRRRNVINRITSDTNDQLRLSENQGDKSQDDKNQSDKSQDTENLNATTTEQSQKSDIKESPNLPSDYPYPKSMEDSGKKLENDIRILKDKEKTQTPITKMQNDKTPETITKSDLKDIKHLLEDIVTVIRETYGYKKYPYDEKSRQAMEEGTAMVYKYRNYYDVLNTIKKPGPVDPQDFDSPVYNSERIFEILERYSDIIYVVNDGIEPLFVVISHEGRTNFSKESVILPGEVKQYYNVYELRLRSPTVGHPYRVTEYMIVDVSETSLIPFGLASLHDVDLPSAGGNWLEEDIIPIHPPTTIRIEVAVSKTGIFSAAITNGGNTQVVNFNVTSGPELIEDGVYVFELLVNKGDTVNFRYSVDGGKIKILRVQEIDAATA